MGQGGGGVRQEREMDGTGRRSETGEGKGWDREGGGGMRQERERDGTGREEEE